MATAEEYMEVFKKGTIVEVSSDDEGLRGSWYTATVLRTISKKTNKMLVEYHNLMADDDPSKPLREFVDAILVRPIPPRDSPSRRYRLMEDVDAFHNDGWWEGVVTKVIDSGGSRRYAVFFRCSREQIEFSASDLRLHREWVRGDTWIIPVDLSLSPRQKRKNGDREERRNGAHSIDKNGITSNGKAGDIGKRGRNVSSKEIAVANNGSCTGITRTSKRTGNKDAMASKRQERGLKIVSNGTSNKLGVKRNGILKEPRTRASNHAERIRHGFPYQPQLEGFGFGWKICGERWCQRRMCFNFEGPTNHQDLGGITFLFLLGMHRWCWLISCVFM